jgi:two-component system, cell cycle response regulator
MLPRVATHLVSGPSPATASTSLRRGPKKAEPKPAAIHRRSAGDEQERARLIQEIERLEMLPFADVDAAFAPARVAEAKARDMGAENLVRRAQLVQADVLGRKGKHTASGQLLREINSWALEHDDKHLLARSHRLLAGFFDSIGDAPSAWEHARRSVELLDPSMSDRLRADHLCGLGLALTRTGAYAAARERYGTARRLAEHLHDPMLELKILNNLAWLEDEAGDARRALDIARRMQRFAARHQLTLDAACLDTVAHSQLILGRATEAEHTLQPVLNASDFEDWPSEGLAEALLTGATSQRVQGHLEAAQVTLARCLDVCQSRESQAIRILALEEQAELYAAHGDYEKAFQQHITFHNADFELRDAAREANARTLNAVFETAEARLEGEHFRELSLRDALTGLHNRRHVQTELPRLLAQAVLSGSKLALALVDLDHFKKVNDSFSHGVGDAVLCRVAAMLAASAGERGLAARMGGDEFLLVFPYSATR